MKVEKSTLSFQNAPEAAASTKQHLMALSAANVEV